MAFSGTRETNTTPARGGTEKNVRAKLRRWFRQNGRDLPWRRTRDPYAIMVSEFMCQQTTVAAVVPYFERWMEALPTVGALAEAPEDRVLALWQGLGYYSRARNLQRAAQAVVARHGGVVPRALADLRALPGVGDYTAAAVAAFAFDAVVPVIDANIARVLARLGDWRHPIDDAKGREFLYTAATALLPARGGALHTSALMEFGALHCLPRRPRCDGCPVRIACRAEDPGALPVKRARPPVTEAVDRRAFVESGGRIWLEPSPGPRWRGLWLLPESPTAGPILHAATYPLTRYRIRLEVRRGRKHAGLTGFAPGVLPPMPSPHRRAVAALLGNGHSPANA